MWLMPEWRLQPRRGDMEIHVVSTLTPDDEERVASALLTALAELLDGLPIAYAVRIKTSGARVVQRTNLGNEANVANSRRTILQ
jgi:hypothetical protein